MGEGRGEVGRMKGELELERMTVASRRSTLTDQSITHLTLSTQNNLLQSQNKSLQSSLQTDSNTLSSYALSLSRAEERIKELETEAREAEGVRRKLHNVVQELKGNIRVFCRVRPVLALEGEGEGRADIRYPDRRDRREIVLESTSESAMGQERKEVYNFGFDRVRFLPPLHHVCMHALMPNTERRYSSPLQHKKKSSKRSPSSRRAVRTGIMFVFSRMGRRGVGRVLRWRVGGYVFLSLSVGFRRY